jgi:hypothetical protein
LLADQAARLRPAAVALGDGTGLAGLDLPAGTERVGGPDALERLATRDDVDLVVVGTGGVVSLRPVLAALRAGKVVATANKETLVAGGHLVMREAHARADERAAADPSDPLAVALAWLRPIDSEHSAIWRCTVGEPRAAIGRLILTASGGPFLDDARMLAAVTPAMALHPTWSMGAGSRSTRPPGELEVIEAHWLYDVRRRDRRRHSETRASAVQRPLKAFGTPDMRLPRLPTASRRGAPDLLAIGSSTSASPTRPDPALRIAREAASGPGVRGRGEGGVADSRRDAGLPGSRHPGARSNATARGRPARRGRADRARRRGPGRIRDRPGRRCVRMIGLFQSAITILLFIFILGALVLIHELGHFVTARWATNEADKRLLHSAVCKAAVAPAAHPDTVRTIEIGDPATVHAAVDDLIPRPVPRC